MDTNPLKKIDPDNYFKIGMVASFPILVLSFTVEFVSFDNNVAQLLFFGLFLVSLGEFACHGYRVEEVRLSETQVVNHRKLIRKHRLSGYMITSVGVLLILSAVWLHFYRLAP